MALVQHFPALKPVPEPVCSVCIANYNGVEVLADCIDSVMAQQGGAALEIIVHDDASTDGSVEWIRQHYPNVELLAASGNAGFCVANNRMVAHARGEFVLLLNNDAALYPDAIQTLLSSAQARTVPGISTLPQYDWWSGELVDRGCLLDLFYNPVPNLDVAREDVAYVIGACLFMSRELWNRLGGFPEWLGSIAEDIHVCCVARLRGVRVCALPTSGFRHRLGHSFGGARVDDHAINTTYRRRQLSERNKTFVMFVCTPTFVMWPVLLLHLVGLCVEGIVLSVLRLDPGIFLKIYANVPVSFCRELPSLWHWRRVVQQSRTQGVRRYFGPFVWMPRKLTMLWRMGVPRIRK